MRSTANRNQERLFALWKRHIDSARAGGQYRIRVEDRELDGGLITIGGRRLVNFGSCAYLGLNTDQRLKDGAKAAIDRFGPVFSSSSAYTSVDLYTDLEERLSRILGGHVVVPTTTTLAHLAALPVLIGEGDLALVDTQAHATVHLATQLLVAEGIPVTAVPHNDMSALEKTLTEESEKYRRVWLLADGVYSMYGDVAPVGAFMDLLDRFPNLHLYIDDAHGFGWKGLHGRGWVLDQTGWHPRMVVVVSLAKSFGSGGAALAFPDKDSAERVLDFGGTMNFSGPLHPAELGAAVASADIHLSSEHVTRQKALFAQIELVKAALAAARVPVIATEPTPIWLIWVGRHSHAVELGQRMMKAGFYMNLASFPVVPVGQSGLRFTHTLYHSDDQILSMIEVLKREVKDIVGDIEIVIDLTSEALTDR